MGVTPADLLQEVKAILTPDRFSDDLFKDIEDLPPAVLDTEEDDSAAPSLPIILFSAASGVAGGVIGLYIGYALLGLNAALSAGLASGRKRMPNSGIGVGRQRRPSQVCTSQ